MSTWTYNGESALEPAESVETDPVYTAGGATDAELAAAVAALNTALAAKQAASTAATDAELASAVAALDAAIDALPTGSEVDATVAAAIAAHAAGDATDAELAAAVASLTASIALKQDASTAATDTELADAVSDLEDLLAAHEAGDATDAELTAAVSSLTTLISAKQDASTAATDTELAAHTSRTDNPHSVTKTQVGLANVDNTSDAGKPVSTAQQAALDAKQDAATAATDAELASEASTRAAADTALDGRVDALEARARVLIRRESVKTLTTGVAWPIEWEYVEEENPSTVWDAAAQTQVVIPEAGIYQISAAAYFGATGTGSRFLFLKQNGSVLEFDVRPGTTAFSPAPALALPLLAMPGDVITLEALQDAGANRNLTAARVGFVKTSDVPYTSRIATLGDSLSEGEDLNLGYVRALRAELPTTHVLAQGNGGETTTQMLARVTADIVNWHPAAVAVLGGTNDLNTAVAVATIESNLTSIYNACTAAGIDVIAMTVPPAQGFFDATEESNRQTLNTWIRARSAPITVVDADAILRDPANQANLLAAYNYGDGVHLSAAGNTALAQAVAAAV